MLLVTIIASLSLFARGALAQNVSSAISSPTTTSNGGLFATNFHLTVERQLSSASRTLAMYPQR